MTALEAPSSHMAAGSNCNRTDGQRGRSPHSLKACCPRGLLSQRPAVPEACCSRGLLSQRPAVPEACCPRGLLSQRPAVPEACCPRGLLSQRPAVPGTCMLMTARPHSLPRTRQVMVKMAGACEGCPSSTITLKSGIENMLMHYVPGALWVCLCAYCGHVSVVAVDVPVWVLCLCADCVCAGDAHVRTVCVGAAPECGLCLCGCCACVDCACVWMLCHCCGCACASAMDMPGRCVCAVGLPARALWVRMCSIKRPSCDRTESRPHYTQHEVSTALHTARSLDRTAHSTKSRQHCTQHEVSTALHTARSLRRTTRSS
eukprot:365910-Chlamydomonas_euryale.AAC.42